MRNRKKDNPFSITAAALIRECDEPNITLSGDEYKALLRKAVAFDLIVNVCNDPDAAETMKYNWPDVLSVLCKAAFPTSSPKHSCPSGCWCADRQDGDSPDIPDKTDTEGGDG